MRAMLMRLSRARESAIFFFPLPPSSLPSRRYPNGGAAPFARFRVSLAMVVGGVGVPSSLYVSLLYRLPLLYLARAPINQGWAEPTWRDTVEVGRKPVSRRQRLAEFIAGRRRGGLLSCSALSFLLASPVQVFLSPILSCPPRTLAAVLSFNHLPLSDVFRYQSTIIGIIPRIIGGARVSS